MKLVVTNGLLSADVLSVIRNWQLATGNWQQVTAFSKVTEVTPIK
jgi:hypothetical protein